MKKFKYTGGLAQLARAPALHAGGHRFDSDILHNKKYIDILELIEVVNNREKKLISLISY